MKPKFSGGFARWKIPAHGIWLLCCALITSGKLALNAATEDPPAEIESNVKFVRPVSGGHLELELMSDTNRAFLDVADGLGKSPALFSRIRVPGGVAILDQPGGARLTVSNLNQIRFLTGSVLPLVNSVAELGRLGSAGQRARCVAHLEGLVLATDPGASMVALQDATGVILLKIGRPEPFPEIGQTIVLEGNCEVEGDHTLLLRNPPLVENDDIHAMTEKSGAIFLTAGRHPFRLDWFNQTYPYGLEVYYQGPDLPRQKIPVEALFRQVTGPVDGIPHWVNGLDYRCYQGNWLRVPDFGPLIPVKQGVTTNFDLGVIPRINDVGLEFAGYLEVPRTGIYTFTSISDDGSLMYMDETPPVIQVTGSNAPPDPVFITAHESLRDDQEARWSQTEGTVTFASEQSGELELELSSETGQMRVEVADSLGSSPQLLLNSRIRANGICLGTHTTDGQNIAGTLLVPSMGQIEMLEVPDERWSEHALISIGSLAGLAGASDAETIVHVHGKIDSPSGRSWFVQDGTGAVRVETMQPPPHAGVATVEVLGRWRRNNTNLVLQCAVFREITSEPRAEPAVLPILTTIEQIKYLTREQWQQGYPVKIRGVITTVLDGGFFIQDSTRSIYARWQAPTDNDAPRVGEYWEIEGKTFAEFAPNIQASRATRLGMGTLPEPIHPTWDQLINGSLDTEYVEVQGIITTVESGEATLLMRAGKIRLLLPDVQDATVRRCENALVRVRGCVIPVRDIRTQQVEPGQVRLSNVSIAVDEPPPADPFVVPLKHPFDLLLFDGRAGAFERVKMAGQIVHERGGEYYLMDGRDGLRFTPKNADKLEVGELVEVVGFPELGRSSPVLREAAVHRMGTASLPDAQRLPVNALLSRRYDATLVCIQARLTGLTLDQSGQVLELQAGTREFLAHLGANKGLLRDIPPGSLLELTGVYAGAGSDLASGRDIDSFELLLNSVTDVKVLARPSWWTLRHTLSVLGGMGLLIFGGMVWIAQLRRQVEERSSQLAAEIRRHENTERQRVLEEERTRIARDLHDDLGATLTQIRFLSALESRDVQVPGSTRSRMEQVSEKSREMVASLDEIVWAVNPANDRLPSLANYLCHFAEEFFRSTAIRCRLDVDEILPPVALTSELRHNLYLAVREALNNIAKHSRATEVWLRIRWQRPELHIIIEDNGCGFTPSAGDPDGNGLANMGQRLEKVGGRFEFETRPGAGVICRLYLPVEDPLLPRHEA